MDYFSQLSMSQNLNDRPIQRKIFSELTSEERMELEKKYNQEKERPLNFSNVRTLVNWLFVLSTGGMIGVLTYIGVKKYIYHLACSFMLIFFGIIAIYLSKSIEKHDLIKRAANWHNLIQNFILNN